VITDLNGNILSCNESFSRLIQYDLNEIEKLNINEISFEEDIEENASLRKKLVEGRVQFLEIEKRYLTKKKNEVHVLLKSVIQKNEKNEVQSILSQVVDITDINNTQEKLKISEKSYRDLFDNSYDLLYILNKKNEFIDVNKSVIEKYGYSKEEIIGQHPQLFSAPDLNDLNDVKEKLIKAHKGEEQNLLWWSRKKNGEVFPKDLNLKNVLYKGEEVLMASGRDVSESYSYERKLEEKEKRYRDLFERNLAGVYRTTFDGQLLECNNSFAKILGFKDKKEIQKEANAKDFYLYPEERETLVKALKKDKNVKGNKIHLKRKNGIEITTLLNVSAIYDANQNFSYFEGSLIDITELDRAQELLKESQEKYRKLIDNAAFGVLIFNQDRVIFSNVKAKEILAFQSSDEIIGIEQNRLIRKAEKAEFDKMLQAIEYGKHLPFVEMKLKGKDGLVVDVEIKAGEVNFENKDCLLISFIDITDRKKIERVRAKAKSAETFNKILQAELKEKEKAQKRLIDAQSYTEGIIQSSIDMIFTTDINGRLNKLNSAAVQELKVTNKVADKKEIDFIFNDKQEASKVLDSLKKNKTFSGEVHLLRSDQTSFAAYLSLSYLYNSDEVILGIMGVGRDISDIKQKEIEIKKQAAKLNAIIESSSHFFFTVNKELLLTSYNHVFESDVVNNIGKNIYDKMHFFEIFPDYLSDEYKNLSTFWSEKFNITFKGQAINFELERKNLNGGTYFREFYLNPIYNDEGKVVEISGIGHDITDKKQSEKELKSSLKEKEVLLKEVHHRVKNNMQVISSILSLQSAYVEDEGVLDILRESQNRIKSMAFIHEKLYRTKDFSLIKFSDYVYNLTQNLVETYELLTVKVKLKYNLDEVFLNIDSAIPCGLIINELISNSLKYAFVDKSNGLIYIDLHQSADEITLRIGDNGIGFPNIIDYKNTDSLGLQLVNTLVEQLEGRVALDNSRGTTFTVTFKKKDTKDV
jgi:PAS domain S-box-containing protein